MAATVAYVMSRFPHLPETFILREMIELERCGFNVLPFPLIVQEQAVVHAEARRWVDKAQRTPFFSPGVAASNLAALVRHPVQYARLWWTVLRENLASPNFLVRAAAIVPQAVHAARLMRRAGVEHVHAHYATHPALFAWVVHRLSGIRYSVTVHAHDIFVRTAMLATKLRDASFIVAISEYNVEHMAQVVGPWVRDKSHVVHCGIEPSRYSPRGGARSEAAGGAGSAAPRGASNVSGASNEEAGTFQIISVGSLQPYKGHVFLIQACAKLRERGLKIRCRIVGGGEERPALERLIARHGLEGVVELLVPRTQEQVSALLPTADCYVQPSIVTPSGKMEGIPVALMEAMASGAPVVATRLSGIPELVREGRTGRLVPPADATALAEALAAVHDDPAGAAALARAGRELVLREFDLHANVRRLAGLFESILAVEPRTATACAC